MGNRDDDRSAAENGQSVILGMGTGRCGTHALAELLNRQPNAHFTHEGRPLLPWRCAPGQPGIRERLRRLRRTRPQKLIGDVALFYLPHVEEAIAEEPGIRIICLERPREEVVASFCKWGDTVHPIPTDHWAEEPPEGWYHDPYWTRIFPQYPIALGREAGIRRYWDEYHVRANELSRTFPAHVRIFPTTALNTEDGVRAVLTFAGIASDRQVVLPGVRSAAAEVMPLHPRRAELANAGPDDPKRCVVLVPYGSRIAPECAEGLRVLEQRGYRVWRFGGQAALDQARARMATDALGLGFEETLWIDPDLEFDPDAVTQLRSHKVPLVCGVFARGGGREPNCHPLPGTSGPPSEGSSGLIEVLYGGGFFLVRHRVYMDIARRLALPLCNEHTGCPLIPLFHPRIRRQDDGSWYLNPDFSFCDAARECGYRILADAGVRPRHLG